MQGTVVSLEILRNSLASLACLTDSERENAGLRLWKGMSPRTQTCFSTITVTIDLASTVSSIPAHNIRGWIIMALNKIVIQDSTLYVHEHP